MEWQPIETAPINIWQPIVIAVRQFGDNDWHQASYGWDDETWDDVICAWHAGDSLDYLGFSPHEWASLPQ